MGLKDFINASSLFLRPWMLYRYFFVTTILYLASISRQTLLTLIPDSRKAMASFWAIGPSRREFATNLDRSISWLCSILTDVTWYFPPALLRILHWNLQSVFEVLKFEFFAPLYEPARWHWYRHPITSPSSFSERPITIAVSRRINHSSIKSLASCKI